MPDSCDPMVCSSTSSSVHGILQEIFPTQGSNPCLLHCRQILYQLSHQGSPTSLHYPWGMHIHFLNSISKISTFYVPLPPAELVAPERFCSNYTTGLLLLLFFLNLKAVSCSFCILGTLYNPTYWAQLTLSVLTIGKKPFSYPDFS